MFGTSCRTVSTTVCVGEPRVSDSEHSARMTGSVGSERREAVPALKPVCTRGRRSAMSKSGVGGVRAELPANQPILLLRETEGERYLPIWIGSVEATAIALEQQGVRPARPVTHDLP